MGSYIVLAWEIDRAYHPSAFPSSSLTRWVLQHHAGSAMLRKEILKKLENPGQNLASNKRIFIGRVGLFEKSPRAAVRYALGKDPNEVFASERRAPRPLEEFMVGELRRKWEELEVGGRRGPGA